MAHGDTATAAERWLTERGRFARWIEFTPAYDRRGEGYGIGAVCMYCYLRGPRGVVQFMLYTDWELPTTATERRDFRMPNVGGWGVGRGKPFGGDLGYHSPVPLHEDQEPWGDDCTILGGRCYYDGSGLNADFVMSRLVAEGSDGLWAELERWYGIYLEDRDAE